MAVIGGTFYPRSRAVHERHRGLTGRNTVQRTIKPPRGASKIEREDEEAASYGIWTGAEAVCAPTEGSAATVALSACS
jgi:hypothetical protein